MFWIENPNNPPITLILSSHSLSLSHTHMVTHSRTHVHTYSHARTQGAHWVSAQSSFANLARCYNYPNNPYKPNNPNNPNNPR